MATMRRDPFAADPIPTHAEHSCPRWLRALLRNPVSVTGLVLVILFVLVAILAPVMAPPG